VTDVHDVEDVFGDGSCIAFAQLDGNLDTTGGTFHVNGNDPIYKDGIWGQMIDESDDDTSDSVFLSIELQDEMTFSFHGNRIFLGFEYVDDDTGGDSYTYYLLSSQNSITEYTGIDGNKTESAIDGNFLVSGQSSFIITYKDDELVFYVDGYEFARKKNEDISKYSYVYIFAEWKDYLTVDNIRVFDKCLNYDEIQTIVAEIDGTQSINPKTDVSIIQQSTQPKTEVSKLLFKSSISAKTESIAPILTQKNTRTSVYDYRTAKVIKS